MTDCVFCRIAAGEIPANVVARSEDAVAFRDLNPQAPTHVLALQRRARQAIKQSRAAWAPRVHLPEGPRAAAARGAGTRRWLADGRAEPPPAVPPDDALTVVVGPEGGLVDAERQIFLAADFTPVRLAPDLLRFETAALAAAAVVASQRSRRTP